MIHLQKNITVKMLTCALIATLSALTTHIYISEWAKPILDGMMQEATALGASNPDSANYSKVILYSAYLTAFMTIGFLVFLYYHSQNLIPGSSKIKKLPFVILILFGIKADLIRQPIMDFILNYTTGFPNTISFVLINHMDKWLANIFLAICLVYLCPQKRVN